MAEIKKEELMRFAEIIKSNIANEFESQHFSGNLLETVEVEEGKDSVKISIPAVVYNFYQFQRNKVIIPRGNGSYASKLDQKGSEFVLYPQKGGRIFVKPKNHIGYVNNLINNSISAWESEMNSKFKEEKRTDTGE